MIARSQISGAARWHAGPVALRVLRTAAEAHDRETEYERIAAEHDAMHGLLAAVEGGRS